MPAVHPFEAVQFHRDTAQGDLSRLVAPPYDVLDLRGKDALLRQSPRNIVAIDLPHVPAKELGPAETYANAGSNFRAWLAEGWLRRRESPALFAYRQTFEFEGKAVQRCGMACTLDIKPFGPAQGGGILPHEETFSGPKEDRMALMKATRAQLSPIFGLHPDDKGSATSLVRTVMTSRAADFTARMAHDHVGHEIWAIDDEATIRAYVSALAGEDVFIADGHHRYTTALNYLNGLRAQSVLPPNHPATRCMFVLVSMSDPGLVIGPTHRVIGGMSGYSIDAFLTAASGTLRHEPVPGGLAELHAAMLSRADLGEPRVGLWDFKTRRGMLATPASPDPLRERFGTKPVEWRALDVAFCQYILVEKLCQGAMNAGQPVKWAFPHSVAEVEEIGSGRETGSGGGAGFAQLAVLVRPTPLSAVRAVSRANELMPQKSTFFYPKLATGLFVNDVSGA